MTEPEPPDGKVVGRSNYVVGKYLTGGAFGRLHLGRHKKTGVEVAVKLEPMSSDKPQVPLEKKFYDILGKDRGIPNILYFGPCGQWIAIVMELLGPTLDRMHEKCDRKFSLRTTTQLAIQLIAIFEHFHSKRLIYRDTKPENFLLGLPGTDKYNVVHIIDLGMCKEYKDERGVHMAQASNKPWTGTVRYMSLNNHQNREQSRRDDLEALGYMLVYFFKGELPWQGVNVSNVVDRYRQIGEIKRSTRTEVLFSDMPEEYKKYFNSVKDLKFEEEPKYRVYINMFSKLLNKMGCSFSDGFYDWDRYQRPRPLNQRQ